jgi:hypothetical protein
VNRPVSIETFGVRFLQSTSWFLMLCWLIQLVRLLVHFKSPEIPRTASGDLGSVENSTAPIFDAPSVGSEASSTDSDARNPSTVFSPSIEDLSNYGTIPTNENESTEQKAYPKSQPRGGGESASLRRSHEQGIKRRGFRQLQLFAGRIRKLLAYHVGIPVSFLILTFVTFTTEAFVTGSLVITDRYFGWSGAHACLFLGILALSIVPVHFFCERIARRYEERTVVRVSYQVLDKAKIFFNSREPRDSSTAFSATGGLRSVCHVQLGIGIFVGQQSPDPAF